MVNGKSLMLVDDDDALREALRDQLQLHEEFLIREAATGAAARDLRSLLPNSFQPNINSAIKIAAPIIITT